MDFFKRDVDYENLVTLHEEAARRVNYLNGGKGLAYVY